MLVEDVQLMPRRALGTGSQARIRWCRRHLHGGVGDVAARAAAVPGWTSQGEETAGGPCGRWRTGGLAPALGGVQSAVTAPHQRAPGGTNAPAGVARRDVAAN